MLEHGGRLRQAARQYAIPLADWVDLSTGINPQVYPVGPLDPACWQRLPEDDDGLEAAATAYYGNHRLLALPGSQAAIQGLPKLFAPLAVACVAPMYEEHPHGWASAGHRLRRLPTLQRALAASTPVVVLCNPNNPTATLHARDELLDAAQQLHRRGGWLVVDEAFLDADPAQALVSLAGGDEAPNLIVLRSLGKFFGLAGARGVGERPGAERLARRGACCARRCGLAGSDPYRAARRGPASGRTARAFRRGRPLRPLLHAQEHIRHTNRGALRTPGAPRHPDAPLRRTRPAALRSAGQRERVAAPRRGAGRLPLSFAVALARISPVGP